MSIPVVIKNIATGEVLHFSCVQRAAKMIGASPSPIYHTFYDGRRFYKRGKWILKKDTSDAAVYDHGNARAVIRTNLHTGEEVKFSSVYKAAKESYVGESSVHNYLMGRVNKPRTGYTWRYADKAQEGA